MKRCPRLAWLHYHSRGENSLPFYHMKEPFSALWSRAYDLDDTPQGHRGDTMEDTMRILDSLQPGESARFVRMSWRGLRVTIPWLQKLDTGWKAIWPMMTARETEAWLMDIARLIAQKAGIDIQEQEAVSISRQYVRGQKLDLSALFVKSRISTSSWMKLVPCLKDPARRRSTAGAVLWASGVPIMMTVSRQTGVPGMTPCFCVLCRTGSRSGKDRSVSWIPPGFRSIQLPGRNTRQVCPVRGSADRTLVNGSQTQSLRSPIWISNGTPLRFRPMKE